ncbi:EF-hand domain-containing protein [Pseudoscourfieldia marina]
MLLHAATSAARAIDDAPPQRAAVFPSIPVAPPPVAPLNSPLYLPPSASPSARYPSNSWTSFVPSAVARLYPVPTASSILTLADLQCRDRLRDAARLLPLLPDEAIARMLGSSLTECFRADPAHVAYLILKILVCFGPSTLGPVATTLRDLHDAAAASHTRVSPSLSGLATRALFDRRQRGVTRATSLLTLQRGLTWLTTHGGFDFPLDCSLLHNLRPTQRPSSSAPCVMSLGILARLERFAASSTGTVFERSHAAAWASQILSVSRFTQIQHRSDPASPINVLAVSPAPPSCSSSPSFHAQDALTDKVSRSRRAFWIPVRGVTGVDLDSILRHTFSDITNPSFIFRDTNAPFADPLRNATAFVNAPLSPHRASLSLQHVLRCIGMPPDEAALYSPA